MARRGCPRSAWTRVILCLALVGQLVTATSCGWVSKTSEVISASWRELAGSSSPNPALSTPTVASPVALEADPTVTPAPVRSAAAAPDQPTPSRSPRPSPPATKQTRPATSTIRPAPSPTGSPTRTTSPTPAVLAPTTGGISVHIQIVDSSRREAPAADAVVWIPGSAASTPEARRTVASRDKRFNPRVTVVQAGGAIDFPNFDPINHNVFSLSDVAHFDLGLYRNGTSKSQTFPRAGVVPVFCNIHPQMIAYVVVVDGGIFAQADSVGNANLVGVPVGKQMVRVWHERGEWSGVVEVPAAGATADLAVVIDASNWRAEAHTRKDGSNYPPPDDDENRY